MAAELPDALGKMKQFATYFTHGVRNGAALRRENHTLKRALTDPRHFDGIGNAYSDEILHRAKLSPVKMTKQLDDEESDVRADDRVRVAEAE